MLRVLHPRSAPPPLGDRPRHTDGQSFHRLNAEARGLCMAPDGAERGTPHNADLDLHLLDSVGKPQSGQRFLRQQVAVTAAAALAVKPLRNACGAEWSESCARVPCADCRLCTRALC